MLHDLSEVDFGFVRFRRDCLEGYQGDEYGYLVIISGIHDLGIGNTM